MQDKGVYAYKYTEPWTSESPYPVRLQNTVDSLYLHWSFWHLEWPLDLTKYKEPLETASLGGMGKESARDQHP